MATIPTYVYILFFILVYMGITRCFPRVIKVQRLFIVPCLFIVLSIRGTVTLFDIAIMDSLPWIAGCGLGLFLGYWHVNRRRVQADRERQLIQLPGDWSMPVLILAIFCFEFFIHLSKEAGWAIATSAYFRMISILTLGMIAGMSMGRAANYYAKYKEASHTPLTLTP